jgi:hypothetical protein
VYARHHLPTLLNSPHSDPVERQYTVDGDDLERASSEVHDWRQAPTLR